MYGLKYLYSLPSLESDSVHGKPPYKKENGTNPYTSSSYSASAMAGSNTNRRPPAFRSVFRMYNQWISYVFVLQCG